MPTRFIPAIYKELQGLQDEIRVIQKAWGTQADLVLGPTSKIDAIQTRVMAHLYCPCYRHFRMGLRADQFASMH